MQGTGKILGSNDTRCRAFAIDGTELQLFYNNKQSQVLLYSLSEKKTTISKDKHDH